MDDINYRGGAHFVTFEIANVWCEHDLDVAIFSRVEANQETLRYLNEKIKLLKTETYEGFDYVVVPFENSTFKEKVSQLTEVKKIQWIHIDYKYWGEKTNLDFESERKLYDGFDKVIFVSEGAKKGFVDIFPEYINKCEVIYNLVEVKQIKEKSMEDIDLEIFDKQPGELNVLLVGRLEPQKAYDRAIDIAKLLKDKHKINWFFLGKGYLYRELRDRCEKYNLSNVHFLGYRENPYSYMKHADIVGLLSEYEGFGLTVVEGMVVGTPVFATKSTGVDEIFDKQGGWLVDNDIYSIVEQIEKIVAEPAEYIKKMEYLKTYHYDNEKIEEQLIKLFDESEEIERENVPVRVYKKIPKVSVIVPVYNMEDYLKECLDSLINQTLDDIEIVIVNDGSTDRSNEIIDDYVYNYPEKIRAFKVANGGLGEARNYGIKKAKGKYLGFVDSDDIVRTDMFEEMYREAVQENSDCVICDYIAFWENGKTAYVASIPGNNIDRFDIIRYSTKFGVVNACTKLVKRELFNQILFPKGFYEDLATMPIILSYANKITYVKKGLYYYRQRSGSITSVKNEDLRLLDCYKAWDRICEKANPLFENEILFAVYWSLDFFCTNFLDDFTMYSKGYFEKNREKFEENKYIIEAVKNKELLDFKHLSQVPKTIHYCWFGGNEKSDLIKMCITSWKKYAPEFEIIEWNETNCNVCENAYVEKAYKEKNWAFVSDYFRLKALYEYGGVYMDTDMELLRPLDPYIYHNAFFAFETPIFVHAGIIGAVPKHDLIYKIMKSYENDEFNVSQNKIPKTIPMRITEILEKETNFVKNGKTQVLDNNIKIFGANMMTLNFSDGRCIAHHHYDGNWLEMDRKKSAYNYRYEVMKHYFTWDLLLEIDRLKQMGGISTLEEWKKSGDNYKALYMQLINSTSWKMTKPLRKTCDILRGIKTENINLDAEYDYQTLYNQTLASTSWKITKPMRWVMDRVKK